MSPAAKSLLINNRLILNWLPQLRVRPARAAEQVALPTYTRSRNARRNEDEVEARREFARLIRMCM